MSLETIVYFLLLFDAVFSNIVSWSGYGKELTNKYSIFKRYFPITRGWTSYYLLLTIWLGIALFRLGMIPL